MYIFIYCTIGKFLGFYEGSPNCPRILNKTCRLLVFSQIFGNQPRLLTTWTHTVLDSLCANEKSDRVASLVDDRYDIVHSHESSS